jgi:hypothetical protein
VNFSKREKFFYVLGVNFGFENVIPLGPPPKGEDLYFASN